MQDKCNHQKEPTCTISVVGYSGSGSEHVHVGKSCLIHRLFSHTPYCEDHLSVISRSDFDGEVVGGSHWLYWGEFNLSTSNNSSGRLRIIEQCEFFDDLLYSPIPAPAPYEERCLDREIIVASRKLAYICKNQLGDESSFPHFYINVGTIHVSVFIYAYDITLEGSSAYKQASFLKRVLTELSRTDTPLVLVTTKHDCEWSTIARNLLECSLNDVKKRWLKRRFRLVETSARLNINVEEAFRSALFLISGSTALKPKAHKLQNGHLEQRMKNLAIRFRKPNQVQYFECKPDWGQTTVVPSTIRAIMKEASESYHAAYRTQFYQADLTKSDLGSPNTFPKQHSSRCMVDSRRHDKATCTTVQSPAIPMQSLSRRGHPPPQLHLHTPLEDTSSVLPTPPPLLLPSPQSPGLFGPITAPSFFAATQSTDDSAVRTAVLVDSAATYPLTRIYLYGSEDLINAVTWTLRSACLLDRFRAKDGSLHRVWILPGSFSELEKHDSPESDQSGDPSICATDTSALVPGQADHKVLGTPHLSAFSAPVVSTADDAPESSHSGHGTVKSMHSSEPTSRSTQSTDLGEMNGSGGIPGAQFATQFALRILVYDAVDQLGKFSQTLSIDVDETRSSSTLFSALLCWTVSQDQTAATDLILDGLTLATRWKLPLLSSDSTCSQSLLSCLLDLAGRDGSLKADCRIGEPVASDACSIDWTSLTTAHCLPVIQRLLGSESQEALASSNYTSSINVNLLAALVPISDEVSQNNGSCPKNPSRRPLFLPPTITAPTAIKPEMNFPERAALLNSSVRFVSLDQLSTVVRYSALPAGSHYAVVIHYLAAKWSDLQTPLRKHLEELLCYVGSNDSSFMHITSILLVGIHKPTKTTHTGASSTGLQEGMQHLQHLANAYNCSFRILNPVHSTDESGGIAFHTTTDTAMPYSVSSVDNSWVPLQLLFLSLSVTNSFELMLHEKALSGDVSVVFRLPDGLPDADCYMLKRTACAAFSSDKCRVPISPSSRRIHRAASSTIRPDHSVVPVRSKTSHFPLHACNPTIGPNFVELPWLPASPSRDWCFSPPFSSRTATVQRSSNPCATTVQTTSVSTVLPSLATYQSPWDIMSPCSIPSHHLTGASLTSNCEPDPVRNSKDLTSSVEEYYAELPKIAQSEVRGLDRCIRRLNRPKRPRPRTSSTNSHSSSSPPSPVVPPISAYPVTVSSRISPNNASRVPSLGTLPFSAITSDSNGVSSLDHLEKEAAVYAEVNDALLPEPASRCSYPLSLPPSMHSNADRPTDSYDTPYSTYNYRSYLSNIPRRVSLSATSVQSAQISRCARPNSECAPTIPISHMNKTIPSPPFVSRPLPTIIDCESGPTVSCPCRNHSSPPVGSSSPPDTPRNHTSQLSRITQKTEPVVLSPFSDSIQHPIQCATVTASDSAAESGTAQKPARPSLSALNNLTAAIRRHGGWFRHSISLRTRKQKS